MTTKFFTEKYTFAEKNDDYHYIPKEGISIRNYISSIREPEIDDSELTYVKSNENSVPFSVVRDHLPQFFIDPRVQVRMTQTMGMGCFAIDDIPCNTIIESCPVILVHRDTFLNLNRINDGIHKMSEYPFNWGRDGFCAFALGYGGIYNHKLMPNVAWRPNYDMQSLQYVTKTDVTKGSQLFIRYLPLSNMQELWFSDKESEEYVRQRGDKIPEMMGVVSTWKFK